MRTRDGAFVKRNRLARLNRIAQILLLNPGGLSAQQIARRLNVHVRTIYRDLAVLEAEMEVPLWQEGGRYGAIRAEFLPALKLSLREAVTLFFGTRLMARFQDRENPDVVSAYRKLATILPDPVARHVDLTIAAMSDRPPDERLVRVFGILAQAWAESRKVRFDYSHTRPDGTTVVHERLVAPYFLEPSLSGHSHYLIGHDAYADALRTFRVERIQSAELTDDRFEIPEDFDATKRFELAWGVADGEPLDVRLLFHDAAAAARARETRWHPSQREFVDADGRLELHFTATGVHEITHWVLTWGDAVEVLAPASLRVRIAGIAQGLAARYAAPA